ncbi:WhiB family transcriptional regulator [Pseudactinotalea sp. HY160]|nr:WhiB family transcriptional regulator [Pseudactinotalea sp. HY160]MPV51085.1 WhiB family transcriptional regulator [Pseudactinotalea sp. HY160]
MSLPEVPASEAFDLPCQRAADIDLWFAERTADVEAAKALCAACPIRSECLDGAISRAEPWGVWGGEAFVDGRVVARKRGRGRPRKNPTPTDTEAA